MLKDEDIFHSRTTGGSGALLDLPRERAGWEWMSLFVRRLAAGEVYEPHSNREEIGLILLGGICDADWGKGETQIGERANVFEGLPYALYLPAGARAKLRAISVCEIAECRVPSTAKLEPRLITPADVSVSLRGGENASRQIVDVMPPGFP